MRVELMSYCEIDAEFTQQLYRELVDACQPSWPVRVWRRIRWGANWRMTSLSPEDREWIARCMPRARGSDQDLPDGL